MPSVSVHLDLLMSMMVTMQMMIEKMMIETKMMMMMMMMMMMSDRFIGYSLSYVVCFVWSFLSVCAFTLLVFVCIDCFG